MITIPGKYCSIKAWTDGLVIEPEAYNQLMNLSRLPFLFQHIAVMPDVHAGMGATIGSVIATTDAIIPSAVGVDIGCGMSAFYTGLDIKDIPENKRYEIRQTIEQFVPTGRTNNGGEGDKGSWNQIPNDVKKIWDEHLKKDFELLLKKHPGIKSKYKLNSLNHLGTLGGGNHFIEICVDNSDEIWIMLHSGSRGVGNRIGQYFINKAKEYCFKATPEEIQKLDDELLAYYKSNDFQRLPKQEKKVAANVKQIEIQEKKGLCKVALPHPDLAYLEKGTEDFKDYFFAIDWAQGFAFLNRQIMMNRVVKALNEVLKTDIQIRDAVIDCHHNYVSKEFHYWKEVYVTRKGAIRADYGELAIIPGSMGAKSYIVEGLGCKESFCSASHGAGRVMSRSQAKATFTIEDHKKATEGIECAKDSSVLDETPQAYKDIDQVMAAEAELVKPFVQLKQIICVKG